MSDDSRSKVRVCAADNCTVRMSAIDKDRHVLCPSHTGWQCTWDMRCDICRDWTDTQMREYLRLQEGKARKKAYKERKKALRMAADQPADDRHAHSLSPSSISSLSEIGEVVPSPFVVPADRNVNVNIDVNNANVGEGNIVSNKIACTPSATPLPIGDSGYVGQGSVVPSGLKPIASKGSLDPTPWTVAEELPSHLGQPP